MRLAIYGMGGSGKELLEMIEMAPDLSHKWNEIIFIDDTIPAGNYRGHKHFSFDEFKLSNPANCYCFRGAYVQINDGRESC